MNGDSYYTIGSTHEVCQDYAIVVNDQRIFLADGCSSSPNTDVGARIVAHAASCWQTDLDPFTLSQEIVKASYGLRLPKGALDATLLIADAQEKRFVVRVFGDGYVSYRDHSGQIEMIKISYPTDAPLYLSYWQDVSRWEKYKEKFGTVRRLEMGYIVPDRKRLTSEDIDKDPVRIQLAYETYDLVLLFSDGVASFLDENNERIPPEEIIKEMLQIKNYKGEFIKRRAKRFLKDAKKRGWTHFDDFSVAALYHKEEADDDI